MPLSILSFPLLGDIRDVENTNNLFRMPELKTQPVAFTEAMQKVKAASRFHCDPPLNAKTK